MSLQGTPADIVANADADLSWLEGLYKTFHRHPELSGAEEWTAARITEELGRFPDWEVTTGIGGYGITAVLANGDGPTVLIRADFDGLPVAEATDVDYASIHSQLDEQGRRVPTMHACGHDAHTTSLLGAMTLLDATRERWSGTVVALFQPAEEASTGAHRMVTDGLADLIPGRTCASASTSCPARRAGVHRPGPGAHLLDDRRDHAVRPGRARLDAAPRGRPGGPRGVRRHETPDDRVPGGPAGQVRRGHRGVGRGGQGEQRHPRQRAHRPELPVLRRGAAEEVRGRGQADRPRGGRRERV